MSHLTILYVASVPASAAFYESVLGAPAMDVSPGFAMFRLSEASMLGLWERDAVKPAVEGPSAGFELAFEHVDLAGLQSFRDTCWNAGAKVIQDIVEVDFGTTFAVVDPDGHRLRGLVQPAQASMAA